MCSYNGVKIIHQTWKNEKIPEKWKVSSDEWKRLHPGWKYILWTDEDNRNLIAKHFPDFLKYYDNFPYTIQRVDAVRYAILYLYGGVYADLDHVPLENIESQLGDNVCDVYLTSSANLKSYYTNCFMISYKPGCKLWLDMIEYMKRKPASYLFWKHGIVMSTTGPKALTEVVNSYKGLVCKLPHKIWNPANMYEVSWGMAKDVALNNKSVCYNLEGSSWMGLDGHIILFCIKYYYIVIVITILLIFIFIFFIIKYRNKIIKTLPFRKK